MKFDDECLKRFRLDWNFWDCVMRAVAEAGQKCPGYLETTYREARNHVAYYLK